MPGPQNIGVVLQLAQALKAIKNGPTQLVAGAANGDVQAALTEYFVGVFGPQASTIFAQQGLIAAPNPTIAQLQAYVSSRANAILNSGITVSGVQVGTSTAGIALLTGAHDFTQANPTATVNFVVSPTQTVVLNATQVAAMWLAVTTFVQAVFTAEAQCNAGIIATPATVTTNAQVDAILNAVTRAY